LNQNHNARGGKRIKQPVFFLARLALTFLTPVVNFPLNLHSFFLSALLLTFSACGVAAQNSQVIHLLQGNDRSPFYSFLKDFGVDKDPDNVFTLTNGRDHSRFGLTTPRKLGAAHERNRIKRRIREILRTSQSLLPSGMDIVLNPRRSAGELEFQDLRTELVSLIRNSI